MDCYFHSNVPSVAPCTHCTKAICATCRDEHGMCPSCRLAQKIDAASGPRQTLGGTVGDTRQQYGPPPPPQQPTVVATKVEPVSDDPVESRAVVALGYPLWPLALIGLLDRRGSRFIRKHAIQGLAYNIGFAAFWALLTLMTNVPVLGVSAAIVNALLIPLFLVGAVYYGVKVWRGEDVTVPILTDWLDEKLPVKQ